MPELVVETTEPTPVELPETLALLPVRDLVLFPYMMVPLMVSRDVSAAAVDLALGGTKERLIFVTVQRSESDDAPDRSALNEVGTVGTIVRMRKLSDGRMKILIQGLVRARVTEWQGSSPCYTVRVEQVVDRAGPGDPHGPVATAEMAALSRQVKDDLDQYARAGKVSSPELMALIADVEEPGRLSDLVCALLQLKADEGQRLLEELDPLRRLRMIAAFLRKELEIIQMQEVIQTRAREVLSRSQREHYLREQLRQIHSELGGDEGGEAQELRRRVQEAGLHGEALQEAERQLRRLETMQAQSAEYQVVRTYLEWVTELPWQKATADQLDLTEARRVLDEDHYDLARVKDRILEFLSVMRLRAGEPRAADHPTLPALPTLPTLPTLHDQPPLSTVLCLVGPPGVGKTSLGRSIARALGRRFVRVSLGGVRDDAEVRGHRRTYVGALPGRLIQGLRTAGCKNPVMLLDEIDKLGDSGAGHGGQEAVAAALLEVLDPEQNGAFRDHYLSVPFDLSQVLFIATANAADRIPQALRDRLELIHLSGYAEEEKLQIAQRHVVPRAVAQSGLGRTCSVRFTASALRAIIADYTREAGLRELERQVAAICRKLARQIVEREDEQRRQRAKGFGGRAPSGIPLLGSAPILPVIPPRKTALVVTPKAVQRLLGPPLYRRLLAPGRAAEGGGGAHPIGAALGLAWTPVGGEVLEVESQWMPGRGTLTLTGQMGEVMRESAQAALSYARARAAALGLRDEVFQEREIHVHVPAGAVPKDGPSAGVTLACALTSLLCGVPVKAGVAMTGELTLRGRVLPVGGVREKLLAALRAGIKTALVPAQNARDLEDIPRAVLRGLRVILVETMEDVLREALASPIGATALAGAARPAGASKAESPPRKSSHRAGRHGAG